MPSEHLYHKLYTYGSKIFMFLMTRRVNNFGHRWCDALIVCSILPLSIFLKIWHIRNEIELILVVLCIQPFPYNMLRIRIFHIIDPFKIWNDQLSHPKGCVKNYWQFFWSWFFQSVDTVSTTGIRILRPSYLKIRLTLLDSLIIFKRICMGPIQRLYGQFRQFMVV